MSSEGDNFTRIYGTEGLQEFAKWYAHYHGYVSLLVCLYGIVTNVFNIIVLTRKNMISPTNLILTGLAISDLLTMISYVPFALHFYCLHGTTPSPERNSYPWLFYLMFHVNFSVTTHTMSIWLGVALAIFRYAFVRLSTAGTFDNGIQRAKVGVGLVYLASVILIIPNYLSLRIIPLDRNRTVYDIGYIDPRTNFGRTIPKVNFWIYALLVKLVPCALMCLFGALLITTMRVTYRRGTRLRRRSSTTSETFRSRVREHARTTRMLVVVIVLFLITELPQGVITLLSGIMVGFYDAVYMPLGDLMDIIALINNAINFTLYCVMSRQFRETFLKLFCHTPKKPDDEQNVSLRATKHSDS